MANCHSPTLELNKKVDRKLKEQQKKPHVALILIFQNLSYRTASIHGN